jgi:hypothetical protein
MELGIYRHWKGTHYTVILLARDSNNHADRENTVVYISLTTPYAGSVNTRWETEFLEEVQLPDGSWVPRFTYVGPASRGSGPSLPAQMYTD